MTHPALTTFTERMDALVDATDNPHEIADHAGRYLGELLPHPQFLDAGFRAPGRDTYQQHTVHVHPQGRYSLVSLVWRPGQATPIHDHRCWCVVGVLEGREREERFRLHIDGVEEWLSVDGASHYAPGEVCRLVPPDEDIHRVVNVADQTSISLHVYGADIERCGTSINRIFDVPVRPSASAEQQPAVSWRDRDRSPLPRNGDRTSEPTH